MRMQFAKGKIEYLKGPMQSPDLNGTEHNKIYMEHYGAPGIPA